MDGMANVQRAKADGALPLEPLVQDVSLAANLRRIGRLVAGLPGEPLDEAGALRVTGAHGRAVPIFWCFNDAHEFAALSQALGDGQPLVGMRSLNRVVDVRPETLRAYDDIAEHYAGVIVRRFGQAPCIVGGNCQAAAVSYRVAVRLLAQGVPVLRLVVVDAEPRYPYPGHVRLLFGRDSPHNPFLGMRAGILPQRLWRMAYGQPEWRIIEGRHGDYFAQENIQSLARAIRAPSQGAVPPRHPVAVEWRAARQDSDTLVLHAEAPKGLETDADLGLLPVWRRLDGSLARIDGDGWVMPIAAGRRWTCVLPLPAGPGPWKMVPVLCRLGHGPQTWPVEAEIALDVP
jgi:hypothetical protein